MYLKAIKYIEENATKIQALKAMKKNTKIDDQSSCKIE